MVKFSKELEAQLIPEWKHAFLNYCLLKKHLKKLKLLSPKLPIGIPLHNHSHTSIFHSIFRPLLDKITATPSNNNHIIHRDRDRGKNRSIGEGENGPEEEEKTERVQLFCEEDEVKVFFEMLDDEHKKVNQFYTSKESEFLRRGESLIKKLHVLLHLQAHHRKTPGCDDDGGVKLLSVRSGSSSANNSDFSGRQVEESILDCDETEEVNRAEEKKGSNEVNNSSAKTTDDIINYGGLDIRTPAIVGTKNINKGGRIGGRGKCCIRRKKIECSEKVLRGAFVELYKALALLKTFSSLNMVAFTKILKKFDKVVNRQESASYLKVVKRSHFISSDKVVRLMDEVESLFTQHFANNDRKRSMKFLRPQLQNDSHMVTFFVGLFTGSFVTLFGVYAMLAHLRGMFSSDYMEMFYPVFSMFALLSLHLFIYGCNLLAWENTRINYTFIFDFKPSTALKYRDSFLICTCLMTAVVAAMLIHLILLNTGFAPRQLDFIPAILLSSFVVLLVCPLNILYRPTRFCFLRIIRNIVCSPFCKVLMVDFFMADQLTSQVPLLRHMESATCYFLAGSFQTHRYETCKTGKLYGELAYVISFAPYYWRAMQCIRRWFDEGNIDHLINLGKYVSAMVAAGARLTYARQPMSSHLWMAIVLVTSIVATVYQLYWDFVKDWGLLNSKSTNPWLRHDLILKSKRIYYGSIGLNFVLRVAWVETVMRFNNIGLFESRLIEFLLASLEVIRRGHWNYYRLENEHVSNVGKFRAVKTVPLPFEEAADSEG